MNHDGGAQNSTFLRPAYYGIEIGYGKSKPLSFGKTLNHGYFFGIIGSKLYS